MTLQQGQKIFDFLIANQLTMCLELGFYHGVSSAYIAGALQQQGQGKLVTIDRARARDLKPNIVEVLHMLDLSQWVEPYFEDVSYTWRLMHFLEEGRFSQFDFCYIDGGHTWDETGFAFYLVTLLLRPGGWVLFDDLDWTFSTSRSAAKRSETMPEEFRTTKQVQKVFDLLVRNDPRYHSVHIDGRWGFAQKLKLPECELPTVFSN